MELEGLNDYPVTEEKKKKSHSDKEKHASLKATLYFMKPTRIRIPSEINHY